MWQRASSHGAAPSARCAHASVVSNNMFVFGGWNGSAMLDDLHVFQIDTKTWSMPIFTGTPPQSRAGHSATACDHMIYVFGGGDGTVYLNDLHVLDTETLSWTQAYVSGTPPAPRSRHSATMLPGKRMLVFGGGDERRVYDDIYCLDIATMSWARLRTNGTPPAARWAHSATLVGQTLFVFGGRDGDRLYDDLHTLDIESMTWSQPETQGQHPTARAAHTCSIVGKYLFFFGGGDGNRMLNETYVLNTETMAWHPPLVTTNSPAARCAHSTSTIGNRLVVFGGSDGTRRFKDIYILNTEYLLKHLHESPKEETHSKKITNIRHARESGVHSETPSSQQQQQQQQQNIQQQQQQMAQQQNPQQQQINHTLTSLNQETIQATPVQGPAHDATPNQSRRNSAHLQKHVMLKDGSVSNLIQSPSSTPPNGVAMQVDFSHIRGELSMDIRGWLHLHNMAKYTDTFLREEIDMQVLPYISESDLEKIGISALGARKKLMIAITHLRLSQSSQYGSFTSPPKPEPQAATRPMSPNNIVLIQKLATDVQQLVTDLGKLSQSIQESDRV
eukprot:TRINITY_DN2788_c0_g2_i3.p1 TRINITY_DN2788_c0_g2~~TRINITY_DN2788_c0_g2_i3.p1  ORF type:complete len:560 (-),score=132.18 TRINITY_DN2788_c0_g2_i3:419-2098(-)